MPMPLLAPAASVKILSKVAGAAGQDDFSRGTVADLLNVL
jgi:hypothetical protein